MSFVQSRPSKGKDVKHPPLTPSVQFPKSFLVPRSSWCMIWKQGLEAVLWKRPNSYILFVYEPWQSEFQ